jgi:hypothetical protein
MPTWHAKLCQRTNGRLREGSLGNGYSLMSRNVNFDRAVLPLEGLFSGLLTCVLPVVLNVLRINPIPFTGAIFGAVISAHFWRFRGVRSGWRVLGFVAISAAAYPIAVNATISTPVHLASLNFSGNGAGDIDSSQFLTGGILGAAILFTGFFFFLAPATHWPRFLAKAFSFTVFGGFLGVFGWALGRFSIPLVAWRAESRQGLEFLFAIPGLAIWHSLAARIAFAGAGGTRRPICCGTR